jgi:hypothetical protein
MLFYLRLCAILLCGLGGSIRADDVADGSIRADDAADQKRTIEYLQKLQTTSGGFLQRAAEPAPTLRATSAAARALHYFGGRLANKQGVIRFIESCYDPASGGFADVPKGTPNVFTTASGMIAVAGLQVPGDKYVQGGLKYLDKNVQTFEEVRIAAAALEGVKQSSPRAAAWLKIILATRNFDGSYGKDAGRARATGSAIVAIIRLGGPVDNLPVILTALNEGQHPNGGWGKDNEDTASDLESTYRVMRAFVMLKRKPGAPAGVRSFIAKCRNDDGGYGVTPGEASTVSGTYYAAIVLHWLDGMGKKD